MSNKCKKTTIGGQALIEGILMRGPEKTSIAVRKPDGEIELVVEETKPFTQRNFFFGLPFVRGVVAMVDSLIMGVEALTYSASFFEEEDGFIEKILNGVDQKVLEGLSLVASVLISLGLFFFLPTWTTNLFSNWIESPLLLNLIEGLIRILIFLAYIFLVSQMEDMKRVFEYHGAEHKAIFTYEKGLALTVENVRKEPRLHPRCGTSFLFSVMIISVIVLSFFGWQSTLMRMASRLIALPIILGISYEVNRLLGRWDSPISRLAMAPGLFIQKIATVKEPDDSQIEVGIAALKAVIPENPEADQW